MNKLSVHASFGDERNSIILVELNGALDHSSYSQLESTLQSYLGSGHPKFICNLKNLTELAPYAIGALHSFLKFIRLNMGDLVLVELPELLQMNNELTSDSDHLRIFKNTEEAIEYFLFTQRDDGHYHFKISTKEEQVTCGLPFKAKIEVVDPFGNIVDDYSGLTHIIADQGLVYPTLVQKFNKGVWEGDMIVSQPGTVNIRAWDELGVGVFELKTKMEGEEVEFPINIICPGCHITNVVGKTDVFRCVHCNEIYFVDKFGHVIPLRPGETSGQGIVKRLEFTMPSDVNYLNHVRNFIVGVSAEEKIDDEKVAQIEMSLDEALANVIEHAYSYDAYQQINISVVLYEHQLEIILRDQGRSFDSENTPLPDLKKHIEERRVGGLGRYLMKTLMDEVDYKTDGHYNQIRMVKKF